jgi:hypothetical protein
MTEETNVPGAGGSESGQRSAGSPRTARPWQKALPWLIALACFGYLYTKVAGASAREGTNIAGYLVSAFAGVSWGRWLALMVPYSCFFFLIDTLVVWAVLRWFNNDRLRYLDVLPIRGSSYILSIINEQVGKGAMALYLKQRYSVSGWEVGSSMLFIMFCEFYYLLLWATLGYGLRRDVLPPEFAIIPAIAIAASLVLGAFLLFFSGRLPIASSFRERPIFKAFREARPRHYAAVVVMRSPALLSAVVVYTLALRLFGVEVGFGEMLGYLPVIFFGAATPGPMRTVAISLWVALFPGNEGAMLAFGFVQHNFFIFFNAAIGLIFLRRANRELFGRTGTTATHPTA